MKLRLINIMRHIHGLAPIAALCLLAAVAVGGTVTVEWDNPTNNDDGTPLTDQAGSRIFYAPTVATYTETNGVLYWRTLIVAGPTNVLWVPAPSNRVTITATTAPYAIWGTAVATYGAESDPSEVLYCRIGKPTTVKIRKVTP